jgi:hypothetical protein
VICKNCKQDNPGQEYTFAYGKVLEVKGTTTRFAVEGRGSAYICDECGQKVYTRPTRGSWISMALFVLCIVGFILLRDRPPSLGLTIGYWVLGLLCVAAFVMIFVFQRPLNKLLAKTRGTRQSATKGKQEAMERLAILNAELGEGRVGFTTNDLARMSPDKSDA